MAGFGYKTSWLAVRDRSPEEVAAALDLRERASLAWAAGTDLAYRRGAYVTAPVPGWTLAHSRTQLPPGFDATDPAFPEWLSGLSQQLGEVQFFATERVVDHYVWARAAAGVILRAYCFDHSQQETALCIGEPSADEIELGVSVGEPGPESQHWSEEEWDAWVDAGPSECTVLAIAGRWSVDPSVIDDAVDGGIYGIPPQRGQGRPGTAAR